MPRPVRAIETIVSSPGRVSVPIRGKRFLDMVVSVTLLLVLALPFFVIAASVALDLRAFPIFRGQRVGWKGEPFAIYKFRTMRRDYRPARSAGDAEIPFLHVPRDDPRITPLGKFLRRYSIDETPQLLNVFLGDMSLIGPRPFDAEEFEQGPFPDPGYHEWLRKRHWVRPGMAGLWQVSGRNDTSFADLVALDLKYVQEWTPGLECSIFWRTFGAVVRGTGAG